MLNSGKTFFLGRGNNLPILNQRRRAVMIKRLKNIRNLFTLTGRAIITLPLGYHPELDDLLKEEKMQFDVKYCMKRISRLNSLVEVKWDTVRNPTYDKPFRFANWLFVGVINNHSAAENH